MTLPDFLPVDVLLKICDMTQESVSSDDSDSSVGNCSTEVIYFACSIENNDKPTDDLISELFPTLQPILLDLLNQVVANDVLTVSNLSMCKCHALEIYLQTSAILFCFFNLHAIETPFSFQCFGLFNTRIIQTQS